MRAALRKGKGKDREAPPVRFAERPSRRFRLRYTKLGRSMYLGHLDTLRVLARLFRRAEIEVAYTRGFSPKPNMEYAPALSLGVASLAELVDVSVESEIDAEALSTRLQQVAPDGISITGVWEILAPSKKTRLGRLIKAYDLLIGPAADGIEMDRARVEGLVERFMALGTAEVLRKGRPHDVRPLVTELNLVDDEPAAQLATTLDWKPEGALIRARVRLTAEGSAKPIEVARAIGVGGSERVRPDLARLCFVGSPLLDGPGDQLPSSEDSVLVPSALEASEQLVSIRLTV